MARRVDDDDIETSLVTWEFTKEEQLQASLLTDLQVKHLITMRTKLAGQKIQQEFNTDNPVKLAQDVAWIDGRIRLITELLVEHREAEAELAALAQDSK